MAKRRSLTICPNLTIFEWHLGLPIIIPFGVFLFGAFRRHGHGGKVLAEHPRGRGFGKREELLPFRVGLASGQHTSCKRKLLFVVVGEDVVWRKGEVSESRGY